MWGCCKQCRLFYELGNQNASKCKKLWGKALKIKYRSL